MCEHTLIVVLYAAAPISLTLAGIAIVVVLVRRKPVAAASVPMATARYKEKESPHV